MRAGSAAVCSGSVLHRRLQPVEHEFRYPLSFVWLDPDAPADLCIAHPLWSARRPAPARFRRTDYGDNRAATLSEGVRDDLTDVLGRRPAGDVRMLTQVRRWGWLFNPITVFLAWDTNRDEPAGLVLEVTNTPWKERHRYPIALSAPDGDGWLSASVEKSLHVSPFLDEDARYDLRLRGVGERIELGLDVVPHGSNEPNLTTLMWLTRRAPTRAALAQTMRTNPVATHRVSAGIRLQAARLWLKRVPFVAHPSKRRVTT